MKKYIFIIIIIIVVVSDNNNKLSAEVEAWTGLYWLIGIFAISQHKVVRNRKAKDK